MTLQDLVYESKQLYLKYDDMLVGEIKDDCSVVLSDRLSLPIVAKTFGKSEGPISRERFLSFLTDRVISEQRRDIHTLMARLKLEKYDVWEIAKKTRAFNLSDRFWIAYAKDEQYQQTLTSIFKYVFVHQIDKQGDPVISPSGVNVKSYMFGKSSLGIAKKRLNAQSTDHLSELLCYRLAKLLDVPCCYCELYDNDTIFSQYEYDVFKTSLLHARRYTDGADMNAETYRDFIKEYFPAFETRILQMILFDFLTRQDDRHQSNWGILLSETGHEEFYKLYDNGRSLFWENGEAEVSALCSDVVANSPSFGLVGSYHDVVQDIMQHYDVTKLINLSVGKDNIAGIFDGISFPKWKQEACVTWISKCFQLLNTQHRLWV